MIWCGYYLIANRNQWESVSLLQFGQIFCIQMLKHLTLSSHHRQQRGTTQSRPPRNHFQITEANSVITERSKNSGGLCKGPAVRGWAGRKHRNDKASVESSNCIYPSLWYFCGRERNYTIITSIYCFRER